ncbi:unnamed protein product, partial [Adineta ricciae]
NTVLPPSNSNITTILSNAKPVYSSMLNREVPGPPFLFGAFLATVALMFALLLPHSVGTGNDARTIEQSARLMERGEDINDTNQFD